MVVTAAVFAAAVVAFIAVALTAAFEAAAWATTLAAFIAAALATFEATLATRTAFEAAARTTLAAFITAAWTTLAAAFITAAFIAALAAFVTTLAATLAAFADEVTTAFFEHKALRAAGNRDRNAITTLQFIPGRARRRRSGDTFAAAHFIAMWAMWWGDRNAVAALQHIAGRAFGTVLMEAGAATSVFAVAATGQSQRATRAEDEKPNCEKCRQALPHEESLVL